MYQPHRRYLRAVAALVAAGAVAVPAVAGAATTVKVNGSCKKAGLTGNGAGGVKLVCTKKGKKLVWAAAAVPTTVAAVTTRPAGTPTTAAPATTRPAATPTTAQSGALGFLRNDEFDKVVAAAEKEGKVTFYTAVGTDPAKIIAEGFEKRYPKIKVTFVRGATGEMVTRLEQERVQKLEGADVAIVTSGQWYDARTINGELANLTDMPNVKWWESGRAVDFIEKRGYAQVQLIPLVIGYNTKKVPVPPKNYPDLLQPQWKGRLASLDLVSANISAFYTWLDDKYGPDFVKKLADQGMRLYQSTEPTSQAIAAGEADVAVFMTQGNVVTQQNLKAPVDGVVPDPALATQMFAGAVRYGPHPNAARVFMDWLLSPEGQFAITGDKAGISALGAKVVPGSLEGNPIILPANDYSADQIAAINRKYQPIIRR